jgi:hypothetical protein
MAGRRTATARKADAEQVSAPGRDVAKLHALVQDLCIDAVASAPPAKVMDLLEKWCAKADLDPEDAEDSWRVAQGMAFAGLVVLFTASLTGSCPVDRFVRDRRAMADAETRAALDLLARAEFTLLRVLSRLSDESLLAEDIPTGAQITLSDGDWPDAILQLDIAAWLAPLPGGGFVAVGPILPLDQAARDEGLSFVRRGKGLGNPRRCAAAVYRHVVRHGGPLIPGINLPPSDTLDELDDLDDLAFDPLHLLAEDFAETMQGGAPDDAVDEARAHASVAHLMEAMSRSVIMSRSVRTKLAEAYSRIAYLMAETLDRRIGAGYVQELRSLFDMVPIVERAISESDAPEEVRALFEDLHRRVVAARGAKRSGEDKELARVVQLIRALRAKTVDQGCSEQEALASARKAAELLDRYGLSLGEIEIREQSCERVAVDTGRKRRGPIDQCAPAIAEFCDCRIWTETNAAGSLRFVFFGLPADVAAAHCIYDLVVLAFATETAAFKKSVVSAPKPSTHSFQIGLAHGIAQKLRDMKSERDAANRASGGRELVPIKTSVIEEEIAKLGLAFEARQKRKRRVEVDAFEAGVAAGRKFEPHRKVEAD